MSRGIVLTGSAITSMMVAKHFLPDGYDLAIFIAAAPVVMLSWFLIKVRVRRHFQGG